MTQWIDCEQRSPEWYDARAGKPTASMFDLIADDKGNPKFGVRRDDYLFRLAAEIVMGEPLHEEYDSYQARALLHGIEQEPDAAQQFEREYNVKLKPVGFAVSDDGRIGASLDRMIVGTREAVEIKCPYLSGNQLRFQVGDPKNHYRAQVQGQMLIAGLDAVHFYAWHRRLRSVRIIFARNDKVIRNLDATLQAFVADLDKVVEMVRNA